MAGYSLGLFAELHRLPQVASDLARHLNADPRGVERLLNALTGLGVIHRHGTTYVLPRDVAPYLVPGADGDATGWIEQTIELYSAWGDLARGIRDGTPRYPLTSDAILAGDPARVRRYIRSVHTASREAARRIIELAPLPSGSSLVDVGCGSGVIGARYARETQGLRATLFDLPPTLEVAREILTAEGLEDQVEFHPGDYRHDPFPGPVDAVLFSNLLQTESEAEARRLIGKARESLRTGGTLLIHGVMTEPDPSKPPEAAIFSLMMYLVFDQGRAYSADEIGGWLAQEGFGIRSVRPLGPPFFSTLITATRLE
jgi:cyclopropane fatty-acyl-phospholipid synthase-like methyltransferase